MKKLFVLQGMVAICLWYGAGVSADVSVYVVRPISDAKILPDTLLSDSLMSKNMYLTACKGEYEPGSFVVKSDSSVSNLSASVTNLQLQGGTGTIPSSNIDIRVVTCWYQAGYSVSDLTHKHLTPELLLKDDSLVNVTGTDNYLKLSPPGGTPYYTCISAPASGSGRTILSFADFPVVDSDSLLPVNLIPGQNKQFWVTVKVPANAIAGIYAGNINLTGGGINTSVRLVVTVPAIILAEPCLTYSLYYNGLLKTTGSISSEDKNEEQFRAEMRNLTAHGVTKPTVYSQESDTRLEEVLTMRNEEGIDNADLYYLGLNIGSYGNDLNALRNGITSKINFVSSYGVSQLYVYGADEQNLNTAEHRAQIAAVHEAGGQVFCAQYPEGANAVADVLDLGVAAYELQSSLANTYHSYGNKIFSYLNPQIGEENPATYRRNFGILLWQNHYDGAMDYAYQHSFCNIWNDFDHMTYRDHNFTYPTMNGVIDTMAWEGFREGVDDVRYLTTLLQKIDEIMQGGNNNLKTIAKSAQAWLNKVNVNGDLDAVRSEILRYTLRLNGLPDGMLLGQWTFNDGTGSTTATDSSGNNNTGTLAYMNPNTDWVDGKNGKALAFNGAGYVNCGICNSLNVTDYTITGWIKATTSGVASRHIIEKGANKFLLQLWDDNRLHAYQSVAGDFYKVHISTPFPLDNGYHHFAMVFNYDGSNSTLKLYIDGNFKTSSTQAGAPDIPSTSALYIGHGNFHGQLDEFKIYGKALGNSEIMADFKSSSLCGLWSFDEFSGLPTASDYSGNGNHGTLVNINSYTAPCVGKIDSGIRLNRTNHEYIDCGNNASLNISDKITVAGWVKDAASTSQVIYCSDANGSRFRLNINPAINLWVRTASQGWHSGGTGGTHDWTGWHHVVWTYDSANNTTKFYFDGVEDFSSTTISTGPLSNAALAFLRIGGGENNIYFDGVLDELRVYNRTLNDSEIGDIYNNY